MNGLVGAMLAGGLILLSPRPQALWRLGIAAGIAVLVWRLTWAFAAEAVAASLPDDWGRTLQSEALINLALPAAAIAPGLALALAAAAWLGTAGVSWRAALLCPAWAAGLVLPGLGRGGEWQGGSVALAVTAMVLSLVLGALLARVAVLTLPEDR